MTRKSSFKLRILRLPRFQNGNWKCGRVFSQPGPVPFPSHCQLQCARLEVTHTHLGTPQLAYPCFIHQSSKTTPQPPFNDGAYTCPQVVIFRGKELQKPCNQPFIVWVRKPGSQVPRACSRMELGCSVLWTIHSLEVQLEEDQGGAL